MNEEPMRPDIPDYYVDLGVTEDADRSQIKKAFRILAILHHPDKRAPGECSDASEFRRAREAYEILVDEDHKAEYDASYFRVQAACTQYHRDLEDWDNYVKEKERLRMEAEELARQEAEEEKRREAARDDEQRRFEEAERARQAAEDYGRETWGGETRQRRRPHNDSRRRARGHTKKQHRSSCRCHTCLDAYWTRFQGRAFYTEDELKQRTEEAQRNTEEAARRAQEEQVRQAEERLEKQRAAEQKKKEREREIQERKKAAKSQAAEMRTQAAARRHREEQEKRALLRMAKAHIEKQQLLYLAANTNSVGEVTVVIDLKWVKKKGVAQCLFCDEKIKYYSFHCPEGGAVACNLCKNNMSRYTLPSPESEDEDSILQDLTNIALEDGGDEE